MEIDGIQGKPQLPVERQSNQRVADNNLPAGRSESQDEVRFSGPTQEFIRVRKLVDEVPDIRENRIEKLRNEVRLGKYNVSAPDIADAILREHLDDLTGI